MPQYNPTLRQILQLQTINLFDYDYGVSEPWKSELEEDIKETFADYEIQPGLTIDNFKRKLKHKMTTIMPYYIKMKSTVLEDFSFNPADQFSLIENISKANTGTQHAQNTGTDTATSTEYPQTGDLLTDIPSSKAQTQYGLINTRTDDLTELITRTTSGNLGRVNKSKLDLALEFRASLIRVNSMIKDELKPLFRLDYY